jgi:hypothetical protein
LVDYDLPPASDPFSLEVWQGQLSSVCDQAGLDPDCLTVALGNVGLPDGLEDPNEDLTEATDTATGLPVPITCFAVLINPGKITPRPDGTTGTAEVGTDFTVDVDCTSA